MSHNNAQEYANDIIATIINSSDDLNEIQLDLMEYWFEEIKTKCESQFHNYLIGKVESYKLHEDEIIEAYHEAVNKLVSDALGSLVDKGAIGMNIGQNGEIYYQSKINN